MKNNLKLGVLGGMGTYATIIFMKLLLDYRNASKDQENINMVITNDTLIPDRTTYILDKNKPSPIDFLKKDIKILEDSKCNMIALTCNTAHYWYNELSNYSSIPVINMLELVIKKITSLNVKKVGLLATEGVIKTNLYSNLSHNFEIFKPKSNIQRQIDNLIYNKIKKNKIVSKNEIMDLISYFKDNKCDCIIFGCTELSVIKYNLNLKDEYIIDSLEELAKYIINIKDI